MPVAPGSSSKSYFKISSGLNSENQGQPSPHNAVPLAPGRSMWNRSFHYLLFPQSEHMNWQLTRQKWPREAVYTIHNSLLSQHVKIGCFHIKKSLFQTKIDIFVFQSEDLTLGLPVCQGREARKSWRRMQS